MISTEQLKYIKSMLHSNVSNYVWPGTWSSLVGGDGHGSVRMFTNTREHHTSITPHTHRYNFTALVLEGYAINRIWSPVLPKEGADHRNGDLYAASLIEYNDEIGNHTKGPKHDVGRWRYFDQKYTQGDWYCMNSNEMHSIEFSQRARILMFEGPVISADSVILEPFVENELVPTFKTEPWMFKRENYDPKTKARTQS